MVKTQAINVLVEPEFHERLKRKSEEMGVPISKVVRRALELWLETGELPKPPERKEGKHKKTK